MKLAQYSMIAAAAAMMLASVPANAAGTYTKDNIAQLCSKAKNPDKCTQNHTKKIGQPISDRDQKHLNNMAAGK